MKVAIIGGIGSGKSAVRNILAKHGYQTIDSDEINAQLLKNSEYINKISNAFDNVVNDGVVDKTALKKKIFASEIERFKLNDIAHPLIKKILVNEMNKCDLVFVEVPLITECNLEKDFDRIWLVKADKTIRHDRVTKRDNISSDLFNQIYLSQVDDKIREEIATDIIHNNGTIDDLEKQVLSIVEKL